MRKKDLIKETLIIFEDHFKRNSDSLIKNCTNDVLWISPESNTIYKGIDNLINSFKDNSFNYNLSYKNIKTYQYNVASTSEIVLCYDLLIKNDDETLTELNQRIQFSWVKINKEWKIIIINISNSYNITNNSNTIYIELNNKENKKLKILDKNNTLHYVNFNDLLWIKSDSYNSIVHTKDEIINARDSIRTLMKKYDFLLRVHSSYIINKKYVDSIHRFYIIMNDGTKIPVPEKKYTKIKKIIEE